PAEGNVERLFAKLEALIGAEATKIYADKLAAEHRPLSDASPSLNLPLVMSNVNLRWSEQYKTFYTSDRIGLSNLGTNDINAQTDAISEIRIDNREAGFSLLLQIPPDLWNSFDYADQILRVVSSDHSFNDKIAAPR